MCQNPSGSPICSSSQLSRMAVLSAQKVSAKKTVEILRNCFLNFFKPKKIQKNSPKIQGGIHLHLLRMLSSTVDCASCGSKISPQNPLGAEIFAFKI